MEKTAIFSGGFLGFCRVILCFKKLPGSSTHYPKHQKKDRMETKVLLSQYLQILKVSSLDVALEGRINGDRISGLQPQNTPFGYNPPWEPKTFIFRGYDPYIEGLKPSFFVVLGSKGIY